MSYTIERNKKGWLASRGNYNVQIENQNLYKFLIARKEEGFKILFHTVEDK